MIINVPKKYNFPITILDRVIVPIKLLIDWQDCLYDKTNKEYLTRVLLSPDKNEFRYIHLLDIKNPVHYKYLRNGYITFIEFNKSQLGHRIKLIMDKSI